MAAKQKQLSLDLKVRSPKGRGGRRPGAGRPRIPEHKRGYVIHQARPEIRKATPAHVTLRLANGRPSLRRKDVFKVLRSAVAVARAKGLEIVHFSILSNHLHLLVEPNDAAKLARSIQSLAISFAKRLHLLAKTDGQVFAERYHLRLLKTPTEVRNALSYVLSNESKHIAKRSQAKPGYDGRGVGTYFINPFSSGHAFDDWTDLFGKRYRCRIATDWGIGELDLWMKEAVAPPRTWLLREGWRKARMSAA